MTMLPAGLFLVTSFWYVVTGMVATLCLLIFLCTMNAVVNLIKHAINATGQGERQKQAELAYLEHIERHLRERVSLNAFKKEKGSQLQKTRQIELEKQEKRVDRSKKGQSKLRKKMKEAQVILEQAEESVREKEKTAALYGLSSSQRRKQFRKKRH